MADAPGTVSGGCLCGAVRYQARGDLDNVVHCHCSMCRRASGAPVVTWVVLPRDGFAFTGAEPATYASSAHAVRRFCGRCGCAITFEDDRRPQQVDVTVGSLDDPEAAIPKRHIWTESRLNWLHLDEHLPSRPRDSDSA